MNESNNIKFAEDNGKWLWKRYNKDGSVIYRSPLFDTEREAREDYDINGGKQDGNKGISEDITSTSDQQNTDDRSITDVTAMTPSESENSAGTATIDEDQNKPLEDNNAGQATN